MTDGFVFGVRGDLQGILLLDTALQAGVQKTEEIVKVELPFVEVMLDQNCQSSLFYFINVVWFYLI